MIRSRTRIPLIQKPQTQLLPRQRQQPIPPHRNNPTTTHQLRTPTADEQLAQVPVGGSGAEVRRSGSSATALVRASSRRALGEHPLDLLLRHRVELFLDAAELGVVELALGRHPIDLGGEITQHGSGRPAGP